MIFAGIKVFTFHNNVTIYPSYYTEHVSSSVSEASLSSSWDWASALTSVASAVTGQYSWTDPVPVPLVTEDLTGANRGVRVKSVGRLRVTEYRDLARWRLIFEMATCHRRWQQLDLKNGFNLGHFLWRQPWTNTAGPNTEWMDIDRLSAPHLNTSGWVNKSTLMTGRSVTLTSSDSIHGSALLALISIKGTEEEIWRAFSLSFPRSSCCPLMNHEGLGGLLWMSTNLPSLCISWCKQLLSWEAINSHETRLCQIWNNL